MDYRMSHQAPISGAPLHDLTADGVWPRDVYTRPGDYCHDPIHDRESMGVALKVRDAPDAMVAIYRAVPVGVSTINPGDWVTVSEPYARQHSRHPTDPTLDDVVILAKVAARTLISDGNSLSEWGYNGPPVEAELAEGWQHP